jgi:Zn-dependent protease
MFNNFDLNQLVVMIVPLLLAVTIHEVAHGYVAHRLGDPTAKLAGRLTLNPVKHLDFFGSFLLPLVLKLSGSPIIFGYAKPVPVNFANFRDLRKSTIYVASAGVIANLALAVVSGVSFQLLFHFKSIWYTSIFRPIIMDLFHMLAYSVVINLVLAIFNLIPVPPLDGGRLFAMLLPVRLRVHFARIEPFGMIIIIFLLITNSLDKLIPFFLNPLIKILLGR